MIDTEPAILNGARVLPQNTQQQSFQTELSEKQILQILLSSAQQQSESVQIDHY